MQYEVSHSEEKAFDGGELFTVLVLFDRWKCYTFIYRKYQVTEVYIDFTHTALMTHQKD